MRLDGVASVIELVAETSGISPLLVHRFPHKLSADCSLGCMTDQSEEDGLPRGSGKACIPPPPSQSSNSGGLIFREESSSYQISSSHALPSSALGQRDGVDAIDSALSDTLQNPLERMNMLKFENKILHFVKSRETVLNVPPMSNSFHRLLVYRIAQRFLLEHTYADNSTADPSERGFSLVKSSFTRIPSPLLIDIPLKDEESNVRNSSMAPTAGGSSSDKEKGGSKPVLMKRDNKNKKQQKKKAQSNKGLSADKEKAYAEARARIFGEDGDGAGASESGGSSMNTQRSSPSVINTEQKKGAYRDRQAEMCDPDFVRQEMRPTYPVNSGPYEQPYYGNAGYGMHPDRGYSNQYNPYASQDSYNPYPSAGGYNPGGGYPPSNFDQHRGGYGGGRPYNEPSPPLPPSSRYGSANNRQAELQAGGLGGLYTSSPCLDEQFEQKDVSRKNSGPSFTPDDFPTLS